MQKLAQNLKTKLNKKKGFTLVEVIVVLIIIAILAAILLPSLTGYIDKANEKAIIAEARSAVIAAQTLGVEAYGEKTLSTFVSGGATSITEIKTLAELTKSTQKLTVAYDAKGKVTTLHYDDGARSVTYTGGGYTVDTTYTAIATEAIS